MQICMRLSSEAKRVFIANLHRYMKKHSIGVSKVAEITGVHQSQVSRLAAGDFKTLSSNVIKICIELGFDVPKYQFDASYNEVRSRLAESALAIWDGTPEDADVVISLLREIGRLRLRKARG
jgi:DNA-binding Xre family transcriptional regulator